MPDAPLPPLPPVGQARWRTAVDDLRRRLARPSPAGTSLPLWAVIATGVLVGIMVVVASVHLLRPPGSPPASPLPVAQPAPAEPEAAEAGDRPRPAEDLVVDVAGAVTRPGLVRLRPGSRVADAVTAAGGPAADAALVGVNQARLLDDGEQVRVPRVGEPTPPAPPPASGSAGPTGGGPAAPVDLNRATAAELDSLPGVGPATAAAIITWRQENGGFRVVDDLLDVPGIGSARLERLRPHVRV